MSKINLERFLTRRPTHDEALDLAVCNDLSGMTDIAQKLRDSRSDNIITYSRKVFIPLTKLCRDVCHYCTFSKVNGRDEPAYMSPDEVLVIARQGARAGCNEALFTLGDKPELRYPAARNALARLGHETTISYLVEVADLVFRETGLLPHVNPGVLNEAEIIALREVSVSHGLMLESMSQRLCEPGGAHYGSPDKIPANRIETLQLAGKHRVPFTSGLLIGIGETRLERIETLLALRELNDEYGHIQEVIVQNFRAKPDTLMAEAPEPDEDDLVWTIAAARIILGLEMSIQAPPNLSPDGISSMINAGINDLGGISPVTPDFVNPEAPWPQIPVLAAQVAARGKTLVERLAVYPSYLHDAKTWIDKSLAGAVIQLSDASGLARTGQWYAGSATPLDPAPLGLPAHRLHEPSRTALSQILKRAMKGDDLSVEEVTILLNARGSSIAEISEAADALRAQVCGDKVTYAINRNINYTNICYIKCSFCAFSKGKTHDDLRGKPYVLQLEEIVSRSIEAQDRGATEVCLQGGIHPDYTGQTYLDICSAIHSALPDMHIHAFSPLEISQGAQTLGLDVREFLLRLKAAGLSTLPGTAAEILDDEVRTVICPDKLTTDLWLEIIETAHEVGLRTTATIMFGHIERQHHVARHIIRIRDLQRKTGGFTEFVPLPFVHMEAPISLRGQARRGPTFEEALLVHAVARLALHPHISNIQVSWVKMGWQGAKAILNAGANDLGGSLMDESISRAAGASHGQEMTRAQFKALIRDAGRLPEQRTTLYEPVVNNGALLGHNSGSILQPRVEALSEEI